jgi:elongation factor G
MGELHLEIYAERMKREYNVVCTTGKPRVAFRETITQRAEFNYLHKKQTGGPGQFARIVGYIEPMDNDDETRDDTEFENLTVGGTVPDQYIPGILNVRNYFWSLLYPVLTVIIGLYRMS